MRQAQVEDIRAGLHVAFPDEEGGLMQTLAEQWIEQGLQQGAQRAAAAMALRQLHRRFGIFEAETEDRVRALPVAQLEDLGEALLDFQSKQELLDWLQARAETRP
jgi:hypothetical protein